uniref:Uncharacterized protein n=1 Tax=Salix viminalis TaxID=40686 RepID=A0A6N2L3P3_SALVM
MISIYREFRDGLNKYHFNGREANKEKKRSNKASKYRHGNPPKTYFVGPGSYEGSFAGARLRTRASPIEWLNPGLSAVTPHPRGRHVLQRSNGGSSTTLTSDGENVKRVAF